MIVIGEIRLDHFFIYCDDGSDRLLATFLVDHVVNVFSEEIFPQWIKNYEVFSVNLSQTEVLTNNVIKRGTVFFFIESHIRY
jgi:hypothetical protein